MTKCMDCGALELRRAVTGFVIAAVLIPSAAFAQAGPPPAPAPSTQSASPPPTPPASQPPVAQPQTPAAPLPPSLAPQSDAAAPQNATPPTVPVAAPTPPELRLPRDLSPWGMFMAADLIVKAVMIGLVFASVLSWTIWFAKAIELVMARRRLRNTLTVLSSSRSLAEASERLSHQDDEAVTAAENELQMSADALDADGVKERIASRLERIEAAAGRRVIRGTGLLATIGATSPFVGLFGTVWGIMNSFIGISKSQTTNLAVVAPGIAEALLATALGLVAAIPAVVMYNMISRWVATYRAMNADASAGVLRLVSRDLDRMERRPASRRPATAAE